MSARRVAWVVYGSLDLKTGGTIYDAMIVRGLREAGVKVEVVAIDRSRGTVLARAHEITRRLARTRPDVLVGDELCYPELAVLFRHCAFTQRVLLVHHLSCWERELHPGPRRRTAFTESVALRSATEIVATSQSTAERLRRERPSLRVRVVTPGADRLVVLREGAPSTARSEVITFVFVGALIPRKQVVRLVRAFARVTGRARLLLVGPRDRDAPYAREVSRSIADDRVSLVGEVSDASLAEILARADALVAPSSLEGYGIAVTEALSLGTPVIATKTAVVPEALASCAAAVAWIESAEDLTRAMQRVVDDAAHRLELKAAAISAEMPTWASAAEAFLRVVA